MLLYIAAWVWWFAWRIAVTLAATLTIQHIIHEEDMVWIETKPLLVGAVLLVVVIRIWSTPGHAKDCKCNSTTGSSGFSGPTS
jgi:ABC-type uncharacterized transport system permease subunit